MLRIFSVTKLTLESQMPVVVKLGSRSWSMVLVKFKIHGQKRTRADAIIQLLLVYSIIHSLIHSIEYYIMVTHTSLFWIRNSRNKVNKFVHPPSFIFGLALLQVLTYIVCIPSVISFQILETEWIHLNNTWNANNLS